MAIDPIRTDIGNIHHVNRYNYANNNPYKFVDPTGMMSVSDMFDAVGDQAPQSYDDSGVDWGINTGGGGGSPSYELGEQIDRQYQIDTEIQSILAHKHKINPKLIAQFRRLDWRYEPQPITIDGTTYGIPGELGLAPWDGTVRVFPDAFDIELAGPLADTLFHEAYHYVDTQAKHGKPGTDDYKAFESNYQEDLEQYKENIRGRSKK